MDESVVFFGTGPVAAASLELLANHCTIEAVVTKPQLRHHDTMPVLQIARKLALPIIAVTNRQEVTAQITAHALKSRVGVLIDFGILIEQVVIDSFPLGIVNSHFSLLPQWRGADPITFALLSGQQKTGVSLMLLVAAMDEGPVLAIAELDITEDMTSTSLSKELIQLSDTLLKDTLPKYLAGTIIGSPQETVAASLGYSIKPSYSRKLTKADGVVNWAKPAEQLAREVRAYSTWPKSHTTIDGHMVIITQAHANRHASSGSPGTLQIIGKQLGVYCGKGMLLIDRLKPAGKADMPIEAFLNGYTIKQQIKS